MDDQEDNIENQIVISTAQLCYLLDISKETVSQWTKAGMPKVKHGQYDLKAVIDWRGLSNRTEGMSDEARKNKAEADWKETKALKEKFHFEIMKEKYMDIETIGEEWSRRILELKNALMILAEEISSKFFDIETKEKVYDEVTKATYEMLEQYARTGKYTPAPAVQKSNTNKRNNKK